MCALNLNKTRTPSVERLNQRSLTPPVRLCYPPPPIHPSHTTSPLCHAAAQPHNSTIYQNLEHVHMKTQLAIRPRHSAYTVHSLNKRGAMPGLWRRRRRRRRRGRVRDLFWKCMHARTHGRDVAANRRVLRGGRCWARQEQLWNVFRHLVIICICTPHHTTTTTRTAAAPATAAEDALYTTLVLVLLVLLLLLLPQRASTGVNGGVGHFTK